MLLAELPCLEVVGVAETSSVQERNTLLAGAVVVPVLVATVTGALYTRKVTCVFR